MQECRVYDKAKLSKINQIYLSDCTHRIEQSDVQIINRCISIIYEGLNSDTPKVGDIVEYSNKKGEYFPCAHIDRIENGIASVYVLPFISCALVNNDEVEFESFDGGHCIEIPLTELKNKRAELMNFYFFNSSDEYFDKRFDKGIIFECYANCWEYYDVLETEDVPLKVSETKNIPLKNLLRDIFVRGLYIVSRFVK